MKQAKTISILILASIAIGVGAFFSFNSKPEGEKLSGKAAGRRSDKAMSVARRQKIGDKSKVTKIRLGKENGKRYVLIEERIDSKPTVIDAGEEKLTDRQRSVLQELQDALDADDLKAVRKALSKFSACVGKGEMVPKAMRERAVEALSWFGGKAAVDMLGFAADPDEEVAAGAWDGFTTALDDFDLSDFERANLVKTCLRRISDGEKVESLLSQLDQMRNSVKADAIISILSDGSAAAKAKLLEDFDAYIDTETKDVEGVKKWQAANPDDDNDAEFYGGNK